MNRKISVGMAVTIVILAMTVTAGTDVTAMTVATGADVTAMTVTAGADVTAMTVTAGADVAVTAIGLGNDIDGAVSAAPFFSPIKLPETYYTNLI